jgi:hypothetical protein
MLYKKKSTQPSLFNRMPDYEDDNLTMKFASTIKFFLSRQHSSHLYPRSTPSFTLESLSDGPIILVCNAPSPNRRRSAPLFQSIYTLQTELNQT